MNSDITDEMTASSDSSTVLILQKPQNPFCRSNGINPPKPPSSASKPQLSQKLPSSQYKGVVSQPNGRWGAQIYQKHLRIWLGTFDTQSDAAHAYDIAVHRFRNRDAVTNFYPLDGSSEVGAAKLDFINSHTKLEIVDMLRKHTYFEELRNFHRRLNKPKKAHSRQRAPSLTRSDASSKVDRELLFEKAVTPSDVGKLNRLVIPKQSAENHFPVVAGSQLLSFEDAGGKVWKFRYSYWNSSQSYVLTKGWSWFVREKGLKAGDVVGFERSAGQEKKLYIDCKSVPDGSSVQKIRLFGVNIYQKVSDGNCDGKRRRERGWLSLPQFGKRQRMKDFDIDVEKWDRCVKYFDVVCEEQMVFKN